MKCAGETNRNVLGETRHAGADFGFYRKELKQGRQAYIICPLIEESDKLDVQNAIDVYNMLSDVYRGKWNVY